MRDPDTADDDFWSWPTSTACGPAQREERPPAADPEREPRVQSLAPPLRERSCLMANLWPRLW